MTSTWQWQGGLLRKWEGYRRRTGCRVVARWPLELVGVFTTTPLEDVGRNFQAMNRAIHDLGCEMAAPVLALSFAALPTIPSLGMTTDGLYHVERREFLSVIIDE